MSDKYVSKFTESGGLTIAYQIWGSSEEALVYVPGMLSHLEAVLKDSDFLEKTRSD